MYSALKAGKIEMSAVKCFLCAHTNKDKIEKRSKMDDVSIKKEGDGELWLTDKGLYFIHWAIMYDMYNQAGPGSLEPGPGVTWCLPVTQRNFGCEFAKNKETEESSVEFK